MFLSVATHPVRRLVRRKALFGTILAMLCVLTVVSVDIKGTCAGLFLLSRPGGFGYTLTDDIYASDMPRRVAGINTPRLAVIRENLLWNTGGVRYTYTWDESAGRGIITGHLGGKRKIRINLSRNISDDGGMPSGLFIGGGLPGTEREDPADQRMNETGFAYYDGTRWYHIWCNLNETVVVQRGGSVASMGPAHWTYEGSRIVTATRKELVLESIHTLLVGGEHLKAVRTMRYRTGDHHVIMTTRFSNPGATEASVIYILGDEPWLGNYGSSHGDVGWIKDRIVSYESMIDTTRYTYAGFFDCGNEEAGEGRSFTGLTNFIEWQAANPPRTAYFGNDARRRPDDRSHTPLASDDYRFLNLEWTSRRIAPGGSETYTVALGMADRDPATGFPVKPPVSFPE